MQKKKKDLNIQQQNDGFMKLKKKRTLWDAKKMDEIHWETCSLFWICSAMTWAERCKLTNNRSTFHPPASKTFLQSMWKKSFSGGKLFREGGEGGEEFYNNLWLC